MSEARLSDKQRLIIFKLDITSQVVEDMRIKYLRPGDFTPLVRRRNEEAMRTIRSMPGEFQTEVFEVMIQELIFLERTEEVFRIRHLLSQQ